MADTRIRLANQDLYIDGRWVGHLSVSGKLWYGALPGRFFQGDSQMDVARQVMAALDEEKPTGSSAEA